MVTQLVAELDANPGSSEHSQSGWNSAVGPGFAILTLSPSTPSTCIFISSPENLGRRHPVFPPPRSFWGSKEIKHFTSCNMLCSEALCLFLKLSGLRIPFTNPSFSQQGFRGVFMAQTLYWGRATPVNKAPAVPALSKATASGGHRQRESLQ